MILCGIAARGGLSARLAQLHAAALPDGWQPGRRWRGGGAGRAARLLRAPCKWRLLRGAARGVVRGR